MINLDGMVNTIRVRNEQEFDAFSKIFFCYLTKLNDPNKQPLRYGDIENESEGALAQLNDIKYQMIGFTNARKK